MEQASSTTPPAQFREDFHRMASDFPHRRLERGECQTLSGTKCTLCVAHRIAYDDELRIKNLALQDFWKSLGYDRPLTELVPSPRGRNHRVVTKRRAFQSKGKSLLGLIGSDEETPGTFPIPIDRCMVEPEAHAEIYRCIQGALDRSEYRDVAEALNYVVIKGNYDERTVVINLAHFASGLRHSVNRMSKHLTKSVSGIVGVFVFIDEKRSQYYMPQKGKSQKFQLTKIFGNDVIYQKVGQRKFLYSPLSFSQTNLSIVERFTASVAEILELRPGDRLLDLYCGYGIFTLSMAGSVKTATGVELSRDSIRDARANAERMHATDCRFIEGDIDGENLERLVSSRARFSKVILDPPRNGTKPGVVEIIAARNPERVLHIFCNIDVIAPELKRWYDSGYRIEKAIPFDMFPGTSEVEVVVSLVPVSA